MTSRAPRRAAAPTCRCLAALDEAFVPQALVGEHDSGAAHLERFGQRTLRRQPRASPGSSPRSIALRMAWASLEYMGPVPAVQFRRTGSTSKRESVHFGITGY